MTNEILRPGQEITKLKWTVYLAGPCARTKEQTRWQEQAIEILNKYATDIVIVDPTNLETNDTLEGFDWNKENEWEHETMWRADKIIFWVPRDLKEMPGWTTNIEFGYWIGSFPQKVFYGRPKDAPKTEYLDWLFKKQKPKENIYDSLEELILAVLKKDKII